MKKVIWITVIVIILAVAAYLIYKKVKGQPVIPAKTTTKDTTDVVKPQAGDIPILPAGQTTSASARTSGGPKGTIVNMTAEACNGRGGKVVYYSNGNMGCRGGLNSPVKA